MEKTKTAIIKDLQDIKKAILSGAQGGVTDTAWMSDGDETIVDRLDGMLIELGIEAEELEKQTDVFLVDDAFEYINVDR